MRILLGGVGGYVVVLGIQSGLVFADSYKEVLNEFTGLAMISIAAGFSERLFIGALERVAGTLAESHPDAAAKAAGATASASALVVDPDVLLRNTDADDLAQQFDVDDEKKQRSVAAGEIFTDDEAEKIVQQLDVEDRAEQLIQEHEPDDMLTQTEELDKKTQV
jgi:hypothetical protein